MDEISARPAAGLSLDLDNLWSYLRASGDRRWQHYPSFLSVVVPRIIALLARLDLRATIFIVGRDAANPAERESLLALLQAGHQAGNHSWDHDPRFRLLEASAMAADFDQSEAAFDTLCGARPDGFRAPGFALSPVALDALLQRRYRYDSSLFPTSIGPLASAWERYHYRREPSAEDGTAATYGSFRAALGPLTPWSWHDRQSVLLELPVTTMPYTRLPVHWTYLHFLAARSSALADTYLRLHLALLRHSRIQPQLILHSTDFLGADDAEAPAFIPGMNIPTEKKLAFVEATLARYQAMFRLMPVTDFIDQEIDRTTLPLRAPSTLVL